MSVRMTKKEYTGMSEKTPETIIEKIAKYSAGLEAVSRKRRRDFHKYPETAWLEMRTSAIIAETLTELGYEVLTGMSGRSQNGRTGKNRT